MGNRNIKKGDAGYEQLLEKQRQKRKDTCNAVTKKYERTKKGKLMRTYRNMQSRVTGIIKNKRHLYDGKGIVARDEFYDWSLSQSEFHRLYDDWVKSGYKNTLSPSIDRIDTNLGYVSGNMRWLTHSENSALSSRRRQQQT